MPEQTYMGVDRRRDHSMRIPRPDLSEALGSPNACTQCHQDQTDAWAAEAVKARGHEAQQIAPSVGELFSEARRGTPDGIRALAALALNRDVNGIWRASATEQLGLQGFSGLEALITRQVKSPDPIIRASAVRAAEALPLVRRYQILRVLLGDTNRSVVTELATALAAVPLNQIPSAEALALEKVFRDYLEIQRQDLDLPSVQAGLGNFYLARGDLEAAETSYRTAIAINPLTVGAYLNLADLKRAQGDEPRARLVLREALDLMPSEPSLLHALGLLEVRAGDYETALNHLKEAADLEESGLQYRYVYAVALHDLGHVGEAIEELKLALEHSRYSAEVLYALAAYSFEIARYADARTYAQQLVSFYPDNDAYLRLNQRIRTLGQE